MTSWQPRHVWFSTVQLGKNACLNESPPNDLCSGLLGTGVLGKSGLAQVAQAGLNLAM